MERFRNRWISSGRNWTREETEPGKSVSGICFQLVESAFRRAMRIARQLSPGNLLLTFILRDVAHF